MICRLAIAILLPIALVACGKQPAAPEQPANTALEDEGKLNAAKRANGMGTISAIDPVASRITIAHGPVAELNWPAMTMSFSGTPAQLRGFGRGDKVRFEFDWDGKVGRIVTIVSK